MSFSDVFVRSYLGVRVRRLAMAEVLHPSQQQLDGLTLSEGGAIGQPLVT